jgi:hypothetical protein
LENQIPEQHYVSCALAAAHEWHSNIIFHRIRFGPEEDICFDRKSGRSQRVMSALPLRADICSATAMGRNHEQARWDFRARTQHGIKPQRGQGKPNTDGVIRWCFADASLAVAFAVKFET